MLKKWNELKFFYIKKIWDHSGREKGQNLVSIGKSLRWNKNQLFFFILAWFFYQKHLNNKTAGTEGLVDNKITEKK